MPQLKKNACMGRWRGAARTADARSARCAARDASAALVNQLTCCGRATEQGCWTAGLLLPKAWAAMLPLLCTRAISCCLCCACACAVLLLLPRSIDLFLAVAESESGDDERVSSNKQLSSQKLRLCVQR